MIGKIAVSAAIYAIDKPYDYRIPPEMTLCPGQRVSVPFGRANRCTEGVVLAVEEGEGEGLKSVEEVLDREPLLDQGMLQLAAFISQRYFCTYYDAVRAILPAGVWFQEKETYTVADPDWREKIHRQPAALALMETMEELGGKADRDLLRKQFEEEPLQKAIPYLLRKKLITCHTNRKRKVGDKTEKIAVLTASGEDAQNYAAAKKRSAPMQSAVLELLVTMGECAAKDLCYFTGAGMPTLRRLE